jgi:hypothetical protein
MIAPVHATGGRCPADAGVYTSVVIIGISGTLRANYLADFLGICSATVTAGGD